MTLKFVITIFTWLQSLPVSRYDAGEDYGARADRLWTVAEAVAESSGRDRRLASFLLIQARNESKFERDVQLCQCRPGTCDHDAATGVQLAHGLWQHHRAPAETASYWWGHCGLSFGAVLQGANRTRGFFWWAHSDLAKAVALMGGARASVEQRWVQARVAEMLDLEGRL